MEQRCGSSAGWDDLTVLERKDGVTRQGRRRRHIRHRGAYSRSGGPRSTAAADWWLVLVLLTALSVELLF